MILRLLLFIVGWLAVWRPAVAQTAIEVLPDTFYFKNDSLDQTIISQAQFKKSIRTKSILINPYILNPFGDTLAGAPQVVSIHSSYKKDGRRFNSHRTALAINQGILVYLIYVGPAIVTAVLKEKKVPERIRNYPGNIPLLNGYSEYYGITGWNRIDLDGDGTKDVLIAYNYHSSSYSQRSGSSSDKRYVFAASVSKGVRLIDTLLSYKSEASDGECGRSKGGSHAEGKFGLTSTPNRFTLSTYSNSADALNIQIAQGALAVARLNKVSDTLYEKAFTDYFKAHNVQPTFQFADFYPVIKDKLLIPANGFYIYRPTPVGLVRIE